MPMDSYQNGIALDPATMIERGQHWTIALNCNQNLLGKVMLVANRPVKQVSALTADECAPTIKADPVWTGSALLVFQRASR